MSFLFLFSCVLRFHLPVLMTVVFVCVMCIWPNEWQHLLWQLCFWGIKKGGKASAALWKMVWFKTQLSCLKRMGGVHYVSKWEFSLNSAILLFFPCFKSSLWCNANEPFWIYCCRLLDKILHKKRFKSGFVAGLTVGVCLFLKEWLMYDCWLASCMAFMLLLPQVVYAFMGTSRQLAVVLWLWIRLSYWAQCPFALGPPRVSYFTTFLPFCGNNSVVYGVFKTWGVVRLPLGCRHWVYLSCSDNYWLNNWISFRRFHS